MVLKLDYAIDLPRHESGGFDHGDVMESNGFGFVAHTATGSVEMYDSFGGVHFKTIPGCPEASGVVCSQEKKLAMAASRGTGKILVIDGVTGAVRREMLVGKKPNGMAWDWKHGRFLAADVGDSHVRIADPLTGTILADKLLPGKPRWCKYSEYLDQYIVNLSDKSAIALLDPNTALVEDLIPVSVAGPHGIDVNENAKKVYIACDGGAVVAINLVSKKEIGKVTIPPNPDVIWLNESRGLLYCAVSRLGVIEVIDIEKLKLVEELATEEGCHTFAFHQKGQRLHAYLNRSCRVVVYGEK